MLIENNIYFPQVINTRSSNLGWPTYGARGPGTGWAQPQVHPLPSPADSDSPTSGTGPERSTLASEIPRRTR